MASSAANDDEDDDYMNMTFEDTAPIKETSLQRTQRLKQESRARGIIKSKVQLAEEEKMAREKALSTSMLDDPRANKSKGLSMMAKMGFTGGGLGKKDDKGTSQGRVEPIRLAMKDDRGGIGMDSEKKRKLREAAEERGIKAVKLDPDEYRERVRKEREDERLEKQFHAAQRMAQQLDDSDDDVADEKADAEEKPKPLSSRPLKSINVLYRGLVRHKEEKERDRRMRYDLEQSLSRLPTYEDDAEDADYKKAMGKNKTTYVTAEDLDEEDPELNEFNALEPAERLSKLLAYLRQEHTYCFWCKMKYPDKVMEGCPGVTEEDHD
ncbi:Putative Coiled-coil domain-containing protein 75 [[Torrubiella] hemipterigena]|uniref:Putative Coiled-coil domain-containing protein 75 n=1 Tax=[Torrubiella] hemipterigena TaxID=1531966 RepID=A0A0A1TDD1_9HYPO|nr:Putative Coiled-coil domain-containing protein 75 [[Torrubiella] hemipterigena]